MNKKNLPHSDKSVADIAKEAFLLLGSRRAAPTPEAYKAAFYEVSGIQPPSEVTVQQKEDKTLATLEAFTQKLSKMYLELGDYGYHLLMSVQDNNFRQFENVFLDLTSKYSKKTPRNIPLIDDEPNKGSIKDLRELLSRILSLGLNKLLLDSPELAKEAQTLAATLKNDSDTTPFDDIDKRLKELCFKIDLKGTNSTDQQELLLRLFRLFVNNIGELLEDDNWLKSQIETLKQLIADPVDYQALENTENHLKEIIYKQGLLKHSLNEAKESIKQMMLTFVERLKIMTENTGAFHDHMSQFSEKISQSNHAVELNSVIEAIMEETRSIQTNTFVALNQMEEARKQVEEAENRVKDLESQLEQMSDLVHEDWLTGSLNERGLEDAFKQAVALSEQNNTPLCVALLDLDNFKELNEKHGYLTGDDVLANLVRVVKHTLRPTDIIARHGGEEFLILLPETEPDEAVSIMQRLQRELTKHFFMYKNERILITFSAGVALHKKGEDRNSVTSRANEAMEMARQAGKNQVLAAK